VLCLKFGNKMSIINKISSNGFVPIIPILVWNILFTSKLPPAFSPESFNRDIPLTIVIGENIFRSIVFLLPIFFRINLSSSIGKIGFFVFSIGTVLYFLSWLILIYFPDSGWSRSLFGFAAPAYTPLIWLVGLSLMADSYYFNIPFSKWHFILPSLGFFIFHLLHTFHVFKRF
jgi:hypothetical protein